MNRSILLLLLILTGQRLSTGQEVTNTSTSPANDNERLKIAFPIKGVQKAFTGNTKTSAPGIPGAYIIAKPADWYYEWPTPKPTFSYSDYKDQVNVASNQEPGYYACRPTATLPNGCGRPHLGVDIYAHYGTPIVAPEHGCITAYHGAGVFTPAGEESKAGGSGRSIMMVGNSGLAYLFMHTMGLSEKIAQLAGISAEIGDIKISLSVPVHAGDIIGYVGNTGGVINPHLHMQILKNNTVIDPNRLAAIAFYSITL